MYRSALAQRLALIVVTDETLAGARGIIDVVRAALRGGAPAIQVRAKNATGRDLFDLTTRVRAETRGTGALLFVNDRLDVALAAGADGAHLGEDDLPLTAARRIAPAEFLLGWSTGTPEEALRAQAEGADYVGVGPIFGTATKADAGSPIGPAGIGAVAAVVQIPVVGIGGIGIGKPWEVIAAGAAGVAVISAVVGAADPEVATRQLLREIGGGSARAAS